MASVFTISGGTALMITAFATRLSPCRDPAKLARALIAIASQQPPPRRFIAGADAIATTEQKIDDLKTQIDANRDLSTSLAFD